MDKKTLKHLQDNLSIISQGGHKMIEEGIKHDDWKNDLHSVFSDLVEYVADKEGIEGDFSFSNAKVSNPADSEVPKPEANRSPETHEKTEEAGFGQPTCSTLISLTTNDFLKFKLCSKCHKPSEWGYYIHQDGSRVCEKCHESSPSYIATILGT